MISMLWRGYALCLEGIISKKDTGISCVNENSEILEVQMSSSSYTDPQVGKSLKSS